MLMVDKAQILDIKMTIRSTIFQRPDFSSFVIFHSTARMLNNCGKDQINSGNFTELPASISQTFFLMTCSSSPLFSRIFMFLFCSFLDVCMYVLLLLSRSQKSKISLLLPHFSSFHPFSAIFSLLPDFLRHPIFQLAL